MHTCYKPCHDTFLWPDKPFIVVVVEYLFPISKHMNMQSVYTTKYNNGNWGTSVAKAVFSLAP